MAYIDYDISIESIGFIVTLNLGLTAMFLIFTFLKEVKLYQHLYNNKEIEEIIEFCDPRIQGIKESIEKAFGVSIDTHSLYFYGHKKSEN